MSILKHKQEQVLFEAYTLGYATHKLKTKKIPDPTEDILFCNLLKRNGMLLCSDSFIKTHPTENYSKYARSYKKGYKDSLSGQKTDEKIHIT